jgi:hypothetical protein
MPSTTVVETVPGAVCSAPCQFMTMVAAMIRYSNPFPFDIDRLQEILHSPPDDDISDNQKRLVH